MSFYCPVRVPLPANPYQESWGRVSGRSYGFTVPARYAGQQDIPIPDLRAAGPSPIPTTANEEAIRPHHCDGHLYPHILHHAQVLLPPLSCQKSSKSLLSILGLPACYAIHRVNKWCEVLALLETGFNILIIFLLLLRSNNFGVIPIPCGSESVSVIWTSKIA